MPKKINDGDLTGLKQDRFRNSAFEYEEDHSGRFHAGADRKTMNVLSGASQDYRGGRSLKYFHSGRSHGGHQLDHEGSHFGKGPKGYSRPDNAIFEDVCEMLSLSPHVDASDIEVEVKDRVVYLRGTVSDRQSKRMAEFEIEHVSGVRDVQNYLTIGRPEELH